jgi:hypothetical protein
VGEEGRFLVIVVALLALVLLAKFGRGSLSQAVRDVVFPGHDAEKD